MGRDLGLPVGHWGERSSRKEDYGFRAEVFKLKEFRVCAHGWGKKCIFVFTNLQLKFGISFMCVGRKYNGISSTSDSVTSGITDIFMSFFSY